MRRIVMLLVAVGTLTVMGGPAEAACHAFTVSADPANPAEGATVTLTITRDAAVNPSSVRVQTVNQSAQAPDDYSPLDERVEFTAETSVTRQIIIADDAAGEGAESFEVRLLEGEGCQVNPNFSYDAAVVTIQPSDGGAPDPTQAPTESPTTSPPVESAPVDTEGPTATPGETELLPSEPPALIATPAASPADDDGGGSNTGAVVGGIIGAVVLLGGGGFLWLRRRPS